MDQKPGNKDKNPSGVGDESPLNALLGSWQCQHCHLTSMRTWRIWPHPDDAPGCCGGELMAPYRIAFAKTEEEARDIKIVSRWIEEMEAGAR